MKQKINNKTAFFKKTNNADENSTDYSSSAQWQRKDIITTALCFILKTAGAGILMQ